MLHKISQTVAKFLVRLGVGLGAYYKYKLKLKLFGILSSIVFSMKGLLTATTMSI